MSEPPDLNSMRDEIIDALLTCADVAAGEGLLPDSVVPLLMKMGVDVDADSFWWLR